MPVVTPWKRLLSVINGSWWLARCPMSQISPRSFQVVSSPSLLPPDVVPKYAPDQEENASGYTMEDVAKHIVKSDCWIVAVGQAFNVSNFFSQHPGGELLQARMPMNSST